MRIPIHHLLAKLGLGDLNVTTPKEHEKVKKQLDDLIKQLKAEEAQQAQTTPTIPPK